MKITKKESVNRFRIVHNRILFWIIIALIIILIGVLISIRVINEKKNIIKECIQDSDCVPSSCCHSSSCTAKINAPNCSGIRCTQECRENTLDCNQASCLCSNNKCSTSN